MRLSILKPLATAFPLLALALAAGAVAEDAAKRPQATPLEGEQLFISPAGKPFRSVSGQPYPVVQWFKEADLDHDGRIDRAEFRADAGSFFHILDRNGDGTITDDEITFYETTLVPELNASAQIAENNPGDDKTKLSKDLQGAAPFALINDAEPVRSADDSFVGRITLKAFLNRADHNFDTLDGDEGGRGYLTLDDLPRTLVEMAATPVAKTKKR